MPVVNFDNSPVEPAHSRLVNLHEELMKIYSQILAKQWQLGIDTAMDKVAREIGFVVLTMVPVSFEVETTGQISQFKMGAENLENTIFDRELTSVLQSWDQFDLQLSKTQVFNLYLFWHDALKLKLRLDWVEPAQFQALPLLKRTSVAQMQFQQMYFYPVGTQEPVHWFDPQVTIDEQEMVLISVIDEVYPDLKLRDRITYYRETILEKIGPGVREPAHFKNIFESLSRHPLAHEASVLKEMAEVLKKYGY